MKRYLGLAVFVFVGMAGWRVGDSMSSDAMSMAVGVLLGVIAGIPVALLVVASGRRGGQSGPEVTGSGHMRADYGPYRSMPPVILVSGSAAPPPVVAQGQLSGAHTWPGLPVWSQQHSEREFKIVGEREEWLEDW